MSPRLRALVLVASCAAIGCEEPAVVGGPPPPTVPSAPVAAVPAASPAVPTGRGEDADAGVDSGLFFPDEAFVEADIQNRDPFRSYVRVLAQRAVLAPQRRVIMPNVALEEMTLIAIVTGVATPYAMLTDRQNVGYVVARGDYIGRPEVVTTGGSESMPVQLNWRVDRIRDNELVVTREDPTSPDRPPLMRALTLHSREELLAGGGLTVVEARPPRAASTRDASTPVGAPPPTERANP